MKRRLFNLAAAVSLGMMLAIIALWVWSYFEAPTITRTTVQPLPFPPTRSESALWCYRGYVWLRIDRCRDLSFKSGDPDAIRERASAISATHLLVGRGYAPQTRAPAGMDASDWKRPRGLGMADDWGVLGAHSRSTNASSIRYPDLGQRLLLIPLYLPVAVFGTLTAVAADGAWRARRRAPPGRCAVCGYDLRATPERCPECGTPSSSSG